ncbi:hypothetical protein FRC03_011963 [Tulasnella sp. 419]|nr:hypothetical protein FRC03_011963 [Tulasnella sp. 419]
MEIVMPPPKVTFKDKVKTSMNRFRRPKSKDPAHIGTRSFGETAKAAEFRVEHLFRNLSPSSRRSREQSTDTSTKSPVESGAKNPEYISVGNNIPRHPKGVAGDVAPLEREVAGAGAAHYTRG